MPKNKPNKQNDHDHGPEVMHPEDAALLKQALGMSVPLKRERTLFLLGEINPNSLAGFAPYFCDMDAEPGPITVRITSPGGHVESGLAIYDLIRSSKNVVFTEGYGDVASIAALILQAGDKRSLSENTSFMIHQASVMGSGPGGSEEFAEMSKEIERLNQMYARILSKRSKLDAKKIREICKKDRFYTAQEAVKVGFADAIIKNKQFRAWRK